MASKMITEDLCRLLIQDLRPQRGNTVMVHGGLSAVNTDLTSADVQTIIFEIIGPQGNIVVPTFSVQTASAYIQGDKVFGSHKTRAAGCSIYD